MRLRFKPAREERDALSKTLRKLNSIEVEYFPLERQQEMQRFQQRVLALLELDKVTGRVRKLEAVIWEAARGDDVLIRVRASERARAAGQKELPVLLQMPEPS